MFQKQKSKLKDIIKTVAPYNYKRAKRGLINAGGSALTFLFGTADSDDLVLLNNKIDDLNLKSDGIYKSNGSAGDGNKEVRKQSKENQ